MKKSQFVGFLLTFFFGPLGLLYSSIGLGLFMTLLAFVIAPVFLPGLILWWVICILVGFFSVSSYNKKQVFLQQQQFEIARQAVKAENEANKQNGSL